MQVEDNIDVHTLCPDSSRRQKLFTGGSLEEKEGNPPFLKKKKCRSLKCAGLVQLQVTLSAAEIEPQTFLLLKTLADKGRPLHSLASCGSPLCIKVSQR